MRVLLLCVCFLACSAMAETPQKYLDWKEVGTVKVKAGTKAEASVVLQVNEGFHVQSNPASSPQLIATTLEVPSGEGLTIGKTVYPKGKPYRLQGAATEISVYEGKVTLKVPVTAAAKTAVGTQKLKGKLRYQACNEKTCFFPVTAEILIPVAVTN